MFLKRFENLLLFSLLLIIFVFSEYKFKKIKNIILIYFQVKKYLENHLGLSYYKWTLNNQVLNCIEDQHLLFFSDHSISSSFFLQLILLNLVYLGLYLTEVFLGWIEKGILLWCWGKNLGNSWLSYCWKHLVLCSDLKYFLFKNILNNFFIYFLKIIFDIGLSK